MHYPLSCYYIASSQNTYLTGHQLKREFSFVYRQVLLTGCRSIVRMGLLRRRRWFAVIYHGHMFKSKIGFRVK